MSEPVKHRVLQHGRLIPAVEQNLARHFDIVPLWQQADPLAFLRAQGERFPALVCSARHGIDGALIAGVPGLRAIASFGAGYDTLDIGTAQRLGVQVSSTPDVLNDCVADLAWGALIDIARGLTESDRFLRRGAWLQGPFRLATRVSGKRLGIVGLGRIGRAIAQRGAGFAMDIRYHNRRPVDGVPYAHVAELAELARWADFLVVVVAGGSGTQHLISADILAALGPQGYLVNVARGSAVDEAALTAALQARAIAGAALDVFEREPCLPEQLAGLDNVLLLPHIGTATHDTRQAMGELVVENLHAFFRTGRLCTPIPETVC
ncbi:2-hydroxyacid dehydrogenase [Pseudorhodoferax sp.]|uniref:2-hydroxyacid dehydrogenase n=1 Tax=Pseudorhodoferax sp. TaxID=1993553 RepID=UPI002DD6B37F|nr:2-hydroxyacid dehydrogenase [Pseudorhodoferax sp.]